MLILIALLFAAPGSVPTAAPKPASRAAPKALTQALQTHGWGAPEQTARLDAAAMALATRVDLKAGGQIAAGQLRFIMEQAAISDAQVVPFIVAGDLQPHLPGLLTRLDRRAPPTHIGAAQAQRDGRTVQAVLLVHRGFTPMAPLPRRHGVGAFSVAGILRAGYFKPRLMIAPPKRPIRVQPAASGRGVAGVVALDAGPGVYGVELVAESQYGPVVLINHRVWVDVEPPKRPTMRLRPATDFTAPALLLMSWINDLRRHNARPQLQVHPKLVAAAAAHVAELAESGRLAHFSADSGSLKTRLKELGVQAQFVAENLAEADDPRAAIQALLDSPGHKRNLLMRDVSHIGVAVHGRFYAVVLARLTGATRRR
ncbi:MAG: hypothetical protein ACI9U2_002809 [Bradymonadia bacterium]|jgi:hypothetical protein